MPGKYFDLALDPTLGGATPSDILLPSQKAVKTYIDNAFNGMLSDWWYGVEFDTTDPSPTLTRIGKLDLHIGLPIQDGMRRCLVTDAGAVAYLDAADSTLLEDGTAADLTGASGQVMVEIPRHWRKFEESGTVRQVKLSPFPLQGFTEVPKMYVSAYEAALDRTNSKLASVVNTTTDYRGGDNTSSWDGTYRSLLGMPVTNIDTTTFRTYARARGTGWEMYACEVHKIIYWLFCVEYATFNSQLAFNSARTAVGYMQGGLGNGVTTIAIATWNTHNSRNPMVPCGVTNSLGNATGTVSYAVTASDDSTLITFSVPSYRGIENPFGHIWKMSDGAMMVSETVDEVATPHFYVCPLEEHASWASSKNSYYVLKGTLPTASGVYAKRHLFGEDGEMVPDQAGGTGTSATTYLCDYFYITNNSTRAVFFGGCANYGARAGLAFAATHYDFSYAYENYGSRLCYFPF